MADYSTLKAAIADYVKDRTGLDTIDGDGLQETLLAMVNSLGANYQFAGVAKLTPTQTDPGTPDQNVFYIAAEPGTYTNFPISGGYLQVAENEVAIFKYNGTWSKEVTGAATAAQVTELIPTIGNTMVLNCTTDGGEPAKTVNNPYVQFSTSPYTVNVRLRVRMYKKNTAASGVTLNVNGTGAKTLYYNYSPASAKNTWDDYDVLDISYEGNNDRYEAVLFVKKTDDINGGDSLVPTTKAVRDYVNTKPTTIPVTGYGSMVISEQNETYVHAPCLASRIQYLMAAYHASKIGLEEAPADNRDYIRLVMMNHRHPNVRYTKVVAADRAEDGPQLIYNGVTARCVYNPTMWMIGTMGYIKFSAQINGIPQWFYDSYNAEAPIDRYYTPNPRPMKLYYIHTGEVVDFTLENYLKMLNAIYATPLPESYEAYTMDITNVVEYGGKLYMITTYHTGVDIHPFMLLESSDNGVTWKIIAKITDNYADEVSMQITENGKILILYRDYHYNSGAESGGVWFMTCDINGSNATTPVLLSNVMALPCVFKWNNKVYGCYNIDSSALRRARLKVQISELLPDGSTTVVKDIVSYSGLAYSNIIPFRNGVLLYFVTAEMNATDMYENDIALSELKIES